MEEDVCECQNTDCFCHGKCMKPHTQYLETAQASWTDEPGHYFCDECGELAIEMDWAYRPEEE